MAYPDPGPLLEEHLDELELICRAIDNEGHFGERDDTLVGALDDRAK
jgi:hypothetical protein